MNHAVVDALGNPVRLLIFSELKEGRQDRGGARPDRQGEHGQGWGDYPRAADPALDRLDRLSVGGFRFREQTRDYPRAKLGDR